MALRRIHKSGVLQEQGTFSELMTRIGYARPDNNLPTPRQQAVSRSTTAHSALAAPPRPSPAADSDRHQRSLAASGETSLRTSACTP
jgi:hypothetical protein